MASTLRRLPTLSVSILAAMLLAFMIQPFGVALADHGTLSGTVSDRSGIGISGVVIGVIDGTDTVVGSDTTDAGGAYSISPSPIADATYKVRATPPVDVGFIVSTIFGVVVSGATIHDIVLVTPSTIATYSGTLRFSDGTAAPNVVIRLDGGIVPVNDRTDSAGNFFIDTTVGVYQLGINGDIFALAPDNGKISWNGFDGDVNLTGGDVQENLTLGDVKATVNVTRKSDGTEVLNSNVRISRYSTLLTLGARD